MNDRDYQNQQKVTSPNQSPYSQNLQPPNPQNMRPPQPPNPQNMRPPQPPNPQNMRPPQPPIPQNAASMHTYPTPPNYRPIPQKPPCVYNSTDRLFAVFAIVLGFLLAKVVSNLGSGLGFAAAAALCMITLFNYFYSKKSGLNITNKIKAVYFLVFVLSLMFAVTDNGSVKGINFFFVIVSNLYLVYISYKSNQRLIIFDVLKAVIISPFYEYTSVFGALFDKKKDNSGTEKKSEILPIIIGLVISLPITVMISLILLNSDDMFRRFYENFIEIVVDKLFVNLIIFTFSLPVGMYIFGAVYSRVYKKSYDKILPKFKKSNFQVCPASMCSAFLAPLCLLYVFYIYCQIFYFFKTMSGMLEEVFDYSSYARQGFFELCVVAVINLIIISCIIFFVKYKDKKLPFIIRIFITIFSVLTLCLIVTALVKMMMYIDFYGMTPKRVNTSVFMLYMFVLFVILIIKQIKLSISFTKIAYFLAAAVIILMSVIPVDGLIAKYNLDRYDAGEIEWMGSSALNQLDCSAIKYLDDYVNDNKEKSQEVREYLQNYPGRTTDIDIYSFNFARFNGSRIIKDYKE